MGAWFECFRLPFILYVCVDADYIPPGVTTGLDLAAEIAAARANNGKNKKKKKKKKKKKGKPPHVV